MKKLALVLSSLLILSSIFTGCAQPAAPATTQSKEAEAPANADQNKETAAPAAAPAEKIKITVAIASFDNVTASIFLDSMKQYEATNSNVVITYLDGKNDAASQLSQIESAVIGGTQAVICLPVDAKQTKPIAQICNDEGVPLIALNRKFDDATCFIGSDNIVAGTIQGEETIKLLNGKGNIAILCGIMGQENQFVRTNALKDALAKAPDIKIALEGTGEWKRDKALALVETWLQSGTQIDAILCNNDDMAIGAALAIEQAGKTGKVIVAGIDGNPDGITGVENGTLTFTMFQNIFEQGKIAIDTAVKLAGGEKTEPAILVPFELVNKDNIANYKK